MGRPAILVPLPHAADDHQTANAMVIARDGAAIVLAQPERFTADRLCAVMEDLMNDSERLIEMAAKAYDHGRTDCEVVLADLVEQIAGSSEAASAGEAAE